MSRARNLIEPLEPRQLLTVGPGFLETVVGTGLRTPTAMVISPAVDNPPILIAEKAGQIRLYQSGIVERQALIYLEDVATAGDMGVVGLTIDRNFLRSRLVYVNYSVLTPGQTEAHQRISQFYFSGNQLSNETILLELPNWEAGSTTNIGGGLKFGYDGTLLIGVGDGGKKENAGDLGSPFGKVLRIRPDGTVPTNNPWATAEGWQKYVWAYGLRDPAKIAVNVQNGIVYINDPGEEKFEEINVGQIGGNYGWPTVEGGAGTPAGSNPVGPIYTIAHEPADPVDIPGGHIAGGVVFNPGSLTFPVPYAGDYFFADRDSNVVQVLAMEKFKPAGAARAFATNIIRPIDLAYTSPGDLFLIAQGIGDEGGQLIRYRATGAPAIVDQPAGVTLAPGQTTKLTVSAGGYAPLTYQWQVNGQDIPGANKPTLSVGPFGPADDGTSYTVLIQNDRGAALSEPAVIRVVATANPPGTGGGTGGGGGGGGIDNGGGGTGGGGTGGSGGGTGGNSPSPFKPVKEPKPMGPIDLLPLVGRTPFAAVGGAAAKVAVKVLNLGLDTARGAMTVRLHLAPEADAAVGPDDPVIAETTAHIRIAPGKARSLKIKVMWPEGIDGNYHVLASVDPLNTLPETNEANNVGVSAPPTHVSPAFVDVRTQVGATPASIAAGRTMSLPVSVFNDGNVQADANLTLLIWAVPQTSATEGATPAEAASIGTAVANQPRNVRLAAGRGKTVKLTFVIPDSLPPGQYLLVADANGALGEADATNNASVGAGIVQIL